MTTWPVTMHEFDAVIIAPVQRDRELVRACSMLRYVDVTLAALILLFALPLMLMIAVAVKIGSKGPILFMHERIGRDGRTFKCLKFRSMVVDSEERLRSLLASNPVVRQMWEREHKLENDPRITPLGRLLRVSSMDELPQLWNVIRGDMSLVGPRPIVASEVYRYGRYIDNYCGVRPGLTGLWQVSGRSSTTYRRRVALDVVYSRRIGIRLYFHILAATIPAVMFARGSC